MHASAASKLYSRAENSGGADGEGREYPAASAPAAAVRVRDSVRRSAVDGVAGRLSNTEMNLLRRSGLEVLREPRGYFYDDTECPRKVPVLT